MVCVECVYKIAIYSISMVIALSTVTYEVLAKPDAVNQQMWDFGAVPKSRVIALSILTNDVLGNLDPVDQNVLKFWHCAKGMSVRAWIQFPKVAKSQS